MIKGGDKTGKLGAALLHLEAVYTERSKQDLQRLIGLIAPIMTIFMGLLIGGIIVVVMTSILSINDAVSF